MARVVLINLARQMTPPAERVTAIRPRKKSRFPRVLRYTLAVIGILVALAWAGLAILVIRAEPYLHDRLIEEMNQRFHGQTALGSLHVTVFPELRVAGENLVLRAGQDEAAQPLVINVRHFDLRANPAGLLSRPLRVSTVHVAGLSIVVPPAGKRPQMTSPENSESGNSDSKNAFVIGKIVSEDAHLEIQTDKPGKAPLTFDIQKLVLNSAGPGEAMPFTAQLTNPKPIGYIATKGSLGPWNTDDPRDTPVSGSYSFMDADLATINGIGGILKSKGQFKGPLSKIEVDGETQTPNFVVATGGHPMPLNTTFRATVDGSTGDTYLHPVQATLENSYLIANGSVVRENDGHRILLTVTATNARIEDFLKIAVKTVPPALYGPVSLRTKFILPPGAQTVAERLKLDGSFSLPAAHFSNASAQEKVDRFSVRAEGKPQELKQEDIPDRLSKMVGDFKLGSGVISLSNLMFEIPGAQVTLAGDYQLEGREFSFEGEARMQAKISQMTTGFKSLLLKAIDPFFSKQGAGTVVPIRISGTGTSPQIGLDFGRPKRLK